jgi:hypothetical protein
MFPIGDDFLIYFFAYVVAVFFGCSRHAIDVDLEFLLRNFEAFFFFFIVVLQMLLRFAVLGAGITKNRLLRMIIFEIKIIKALVFLLKCWCFAQSWQIF